MPTDVVRFASVVKPSHQRAAVSRADLAVVVADFFNKGACLPALHPCSGHGDPVDRASLDRDIAPDSLEALATENLAGAGYMIKIGAVVGISMLIRPIDVFNERGAGHAQFGVLGEAPEQELEVVRGERDIGIQIADQVEPQMLEPFVTRIEGVGFGGKLSIAP